MGKISRLTKSHPRLFLIPIVRRTTYFLLVCIFLAATPLCARADDWPTARFDARRSAASTQKLAATLHLQWVREFPPLEPAWPDQPKLQFDIAYDPIVLDQKLIVASSKHNWVMALDVTSGGEIWRYFADGPVRFAPVGWEGRI